MEDMNEDVLCQIFRIRNIARMAQAQRVDPVLVQLVQRPPGDWVALLRSSDSVFFTHGVLDLHQAIGTD